MFERDQIRDIVFRALDRAKELVLDETAVPTDEGAVLLGDGAALDSMGFVNFVVALEEEMSHLTDWPLHLAERLNAPEAEKEPITTAGQFIDFLYTSLKHQ